MTSPFDHVDLANFGLEDNGNPIDQNVSIDGGGATTQTTRFYTRDDLIKTVAENGLTDEKGDLTDKGRTYLLNDQSFLDAFPTPEAQDTWFASFNQTHPSVESFLGGPEYFDKLMRDQGWRPESEKTPAVEDNTLTNADQWHLDFKNLLSNGDQNSGKSTDNAPDLGTTDKGEAEPVHKDANNVQEPSDPDKGEVVPQENALSLEAFMNLQFSLEDPTVPLNGDGSVPSNINTQMAVMPVNDPTKPKTLEQLYTEMDLEPAPTVTDDSVNLSVDEAVVLNTQTNGILASTGFDLTTATEDLAMGEDPHVVSHINALQEINNKLRDREGEAVDILNSLIDKGGVDRETAEQLEKLKTGIVTTRYSLEAFGRFPTMLGYRESLEATDAIKFGAAAAGAAVIFGILIKIVMWIRDKLNASSKVTESNREAIRKVTQTLNSELIRIERDYADDLAKNEKFKANYANMAKKYNLRANFGSTSLLELNDGIRTAVVHNNLKGKYNKVMQMMIEGDKIQQLTRSLIDSIQAVVPAVEGNIHSLLNKFSGADELNVDEFKLDFKFIEPLEKTVGITSSGTETERVTYFNDKFKQLLEPNSGAATPTFNKLIEFKFDLNGAYAFDAKYQQSLASMLRELAKLQKQAEALTDKAAADNRLECIRIVKGQAMAVMQLTSNLIAVRESAGRLLKGGSGATKEAIATWTSLFSGTGITFNPK